MVWQGVRKIEKQPIMSTFSADFWPVPVFSIADFYSRLSISSVRSPFERSLGKDGGNLRTGSGGKTIIDLFIYLHQAYSLQDL